MGVKREQQKLTEFITNLSFDTSYFYLLLYNNSFSC